MKRTIQTLAMLMAITLALVWIVGCAEEEEVILAAFTGAVPPDGSEIAANQEITLNFDNPAFNVTVNGTPATGSGKAWRWKGDLPEGPQTLSIAWENEDASETGSGTVSYTVKAADTTPPAIASSSPKDGDKDQDPEKLNADGMEIKFSEPVKKVSVDVTIEGEPLKWTVELSDDKITAKVVMLKGGELPYESEVVLIVNAEDEAGNKLEDAEITFTTAAKEE
ncbi:TPA: hypothetical protein EYP66_01415 [Candidatus Poribacteria bacterium]|nr:hypothetical protein [Candidatus Poribacteria bacterium]